MSQKESSRQAPIWLDTLIVNFAAFRYVHGNVDGSAAKAEADSQVSEFSLGVGWVWLEARALLSRGGRPRCSTVLNVRMRDCGE